MDKHVVFVVNYSRTTNYIKEGFFNERLFTDRH